MRDLPEEEDKTQALADWKEGDMGVAKDVEVPENSCPFFELINFSESPKPLKKLTASEKMLTKLLGVTAVGTDILATSLSVAGAMVEVGFGSIDGALPIGDGAALVAYRTIINPFEDGLSGIGFVATALSDGISGNTYIDPVNGDYVIGQDTLVSGSGILLGNVLPLEGFLDTAVNVPVLIYDVQGLAGNPNPINELTGHTWEFRVSSQEPCKQGLLVGYSK